MLSCWIRMMMCRNWKEGQKIDSSKVFENQKGKRAAFGRVLQSHARAFCSDLLVDTVFLIGRRTHNPQHKCG